MIRKFIASRKRILLCFSHGGRKYYNSSVIGPKFSLSDGETTRFNWRPWSERLASEYLHQSKNQENSLHGTNSHETISESSSEDEFSELGPPSVISSSRKLDFSPLLEISQTETEDLTDTSEESSTNTKMVPENFKIRIRHPGKNISEVAVHNKCSSLGRVLNLVRTNDGSIDVLFNGKDKSKAEFIADKLNRSRVDGTLISAELLPENYGSFIDSRFEELFGSFRKELEMQEIYLEDLKHLHRSILHLKAYTTNNIENYSKPE